MPMAGRSAGQHPGRPLTDDPRPPAAVASLLAERAAARAERDWATADALRDRIRELGWDPVDGPSGWTARPWLPVAPREDLASRLDEPADRPASVVLVVDDHPDDLARFLASLVRHPLPAGTELIVVANAPSGEIDGALQAGAPGATVLRSEVRLGWADAANLGMRRATGAVIILVDTSLEAEGEWLSPLLAALEDDTVGIAGGWGVQSGDARHFTEAQPGEVDAIEGYCLAVRREALRSAGGFDHRYRWYRNADLDLSFAVRAAGWRAMQTDPLPLARHEHRGWHDLPVEERERRSKRNFYRFLKHWGDRPDLLLSPEPDRDG
jgi:GT2 family glycosyltransferase